MFLRQSTTQTIRFGPFIDDTDFKTAETGLTIAQADMQLSKDGGAFAQKNAAGNATHDKDGFYSTDLNATDTATCGILRLEVAVSGALLVWEDFYVVEESVYDQLFASGGGFPSNFAALGIESDGDLTKVNTLDGHTAQTGDSYARLGAPAGASVSADIADVPTVSEFNARTLVAADYFDPATDAVATVTNLTNLPSIPTNWITAAGINAGALDGKGDWNIGKTGYSLSQAFPTNFADLAITATTGKVTVGTNDDKAGYSISGTLTTLDALENISAADVNAQCDTAIADYDPPTKAELDSGLAGLNDPTVEQIADGVWDEARSGHVAAGSFGETMGTVESNIDNLDAPVSVVDTVVDGIQSDLDNGTDGLGAIKAAVDAVPTASENADQVWDETLADHLGAGSTGNALNAAGAAGDPWATALPGAYGAGTAGKIIGDNINAPLDTIDTVVDGIQSDLDNGTDGLGAIKGAIDGQNDLDAAGIRAAVGLASANLDTQLATIDGNVDDIETAVGFIEQAIFVDSNAASNGDGSIGSPYDNMGDAATLAGTSGRRRVYLSGSATITTDDLNGLDIVGYGHAVPLLSINNATAGVGLKVTNVLLANSGSQIVDMTRGALNAGTLPAGGSQIALMGGTYTFGALTFLKDVSMPVDVTIDCTGVGTSAINLDRIRGSGTLTIANLTTAGNIRIAAEGRLEIVLASSCTAGTITVAGDADVTDSTAGSTVNDDTQPNLTAAEVNAEVDAGLADYDGPTKAEMDAGFAAVPTAVENRTEMDSNSTGLAAIEVDTQDIQGRLPAALISGRMDADVQAISGSTEAADDLEASALTIVRGAAQTGTLSVTQMTTDLSEATDDHYNGRIIIWTSGVLKDQATNITDYAGSNGLLTFTATTEAPSDGDAFVIV